MAVVIALLAIVAFNLLGWAMEYGGISIYYSSGADYTFFLSA